jgi:glutamine---fructose-6-phosphate transaminase (isomerizing)
LHGPIAMVEASFPAFLFCPPGVTLQPMCELLKKLSSIQAETFVITDTSNRRVSELHTLTRDPLTIPMDLAKPDAISEDLFTPIPYIVPAQLFAASLAEVKRLDPDKPRTLSKVTMTM